MERFSKMESTNVHFMRVVQCASLVATARGALRVRLGNTVPTNVCLFSISLNYVA